MDGYAADGLCGSPATLPVLASPDRHTPSPLNPHVRLLVGPRTAPNGLRHFVNMLAPMRHVLGELLN